MNRKYLLIFLIITPSIIIPQQSQLSRSVNEISSYIASDNFSRLVDSESHISLMDSIYLNALKMNDYDISETLLSLTFATVPYKKVPVTLPFIKWTVHYPLVSTDDSTFLLKNKNLPKQLYFDSPPGDYGDKDKVAHFFGNAYVAYNSFFLNIGSLLGYFVEVFEETFKVQSAVDERDLTTNYYGRAFGKALKENEFVLPSQSIILYPSFYSFFSL
jgi:hypothetical protein